MVGEDGVFMEQQEDQSDPRRGIHVVGGVQETYESPHFVGLDHVGKCRELHPTRCGEAFENLWSNRDQEDVTHMSAM